MDMQPAGVQHLTNFLWGMPSCVEDGLNPHVTKGSKSQNPEWSSELQPISSCTHTASCIVHHCSLGGGEACDCENYFFVIKIYFITVVFKYLKMINKLYN